MRKRPVMTRHRNLIFIVAMVAAAVLFNGAAQAAIPGTFTLSSNTPVCDGSSPAVRLNWTASSGVATYDLYRNGALYPAGAGNTGTTFYNSAGLAAGQSYTYFVRARNSSGTRDSNTITVNLTSNVCGTASPGTFTLSNDAPLCDTNPPAGPAVRLNLTASAGVSTYDLYRNGGLLPSGVGVNLTGTTFYNSAGLTAGQSYTYFIRAKNSSGTRDSNTIT